MIRISLNLPFKKRLHLHVVKRLDTSKSESILPKLEELRRVKKGSKVSRFFTHIFEHKKMRNIFGANIALLIIATSAVPSVTPTSVEAEQNVISESVAVLTTSNSVRYPVDEVKITQDYRFYHPGIDLDGLTGDAIYPIMSGRVEDISYSKFAYGNAVIVNHGSGLTSLYAHLSKIEVVKDQLVDITTKIGEMGATGRSSGDHLHLEIRDNGVAINPLSILPR